MIQLPVIKNNSDTSTCTACGGQCCKWHPGIYAPQQVLDILERYKATGELPDNIRRDCKTLEVHNELFINSEWITFQFLRPKMNNERWSNTRTDSRTHCVNLRTSFGRGNEGCRLSFDKRPLECQSLIPRTSFDKKCESTEGLSNEDIVLMWKGYQHYFNNPL